VGGQYIKTFVNQGAHGINVGLVYRRGPNVIFIRKPRQKVPGSGGAIPNNVFFLPVLAQGFCDIFLRLFNPNLRRKKRPLYFPYVFGNKQIPPSYNVLLVFFGGRTLVFIPKPFISGAPVGKMNIGFKQLALNIFLQFIIVVIKNEPVLKSVIL
jgi:hypothetical protein